MVATGAFLIAFVAGCPPPLKDNPGETTSSVDATASAVATSGSAVTPVQPDAAAAGAAAGGSSGGSTAGQMVVVPDVRGKNIGEATDLITDAGLQAVDVPIHGPIDADAGEPGIVYRETPAAGASVPAGTKIELRSWWESQ